MTVFGKKKSNRIAFVHISDIHVSWLLAGDPKQAEFRFMTTNYDRLIRTHSDQDHLEGFRVLDANVNRPTISYIGAGFSYVPHHGVRPSSPDVPTAAETIISYVCTPDQMEVVLGCLQEGFTRRAVKRGEQAARRWYWWQTVRTVAAFGFQIVVKAVLLRELLRKLGL